jgi:putative tryptophan/tyrosine transport system substrate-binding protein
MRSRSVGLIAALALGTATFSADAQQSQQVPHIGFLANHTPSFPPYEGFHRGLQELGYVEGQNIVVEYRWAEGKLDRLPELADELAHLKINLLLVVGDQGFRAAKQATSAIPILLLSCDPVDSLVSSLARPGGIVTGLTCISSELAGKRVELLKEVVPELRRVSVLYNPEDKNKILEAAQTQHESSRIGIALVACFAALNP